MPFTRKSQRKGPDATISLPKEASRFSRLGDDDLVAAIESSLGRSAEVLRGFSHSEIDTGWVVSELEAQLVTALSAVRVLNDRLALRDSLM